MPQVPPATPRNVVNTPIQPGASDDTKQAFRTVQRYINAPYQGYGVQGSITLGVGPTSGFVTWTKSTCSPRGAQQYIGNIGGTVGAALFVPTTGLYFCQAAIINTQGIATELEIQSLYNNSFGVKTTPFSWSPGGNNDGTSGVAAFGSFPTTNPATTNGALAAFGVFIRNTNTTFGGTWTVNAVLGRIGPPINTSFL